MCAQKLYVGTYTTKLGHVDGHGAGIYRLDYDPAAGTLQDVILAAELRNPSYLAFAPFKGRLYAVEECDLAEAPQVVVYAIDPDGGLTLLNRQPAMGSAGCHLLIDPAERWLFVTYYMGGKLSVYPITEDGRLGPVAHTVEHEGSGPNPARQEAPHPHASVLDRKGDYLFVPDLGLDQIQVYAFDSATGALAPRSPGTAAPGAGPRHGVVHPNNRFLFVANELNSTVTAYAHADGMLTPVETHSTLPADFSGETLAAAIRLTRDGRFLYVSNRIDENSMAAFAVDEETGALTPVVIEPSRGRTPRDFILDKTDDYLIAANQDTDTLAVFRVNSITGALTSTGDLAAIPSPAGLMLV
jgi:6-phosphogluconolactonase